MGQADLFWDEEGLATMSVEQREPPGGASFSPRDTEPVQPSPGPTVGQLALLFAVVVGLRALLALFVCTTQGLTLADFARLRDGGSYLRYAETLSGGDMTSLDLWTRRVFPGLPMLLNAASLLGVPIALAGLLMSWGAAGATSVLGALVFRDLRIGWTLAVFTPSYLLYSSVVMTEPTCLAFSLAGLYLVLRGRAVASGLAFGVAGLVRPIAALVLLGYMAYAAVHRQWTRLAACGAVSLFVVLAGYAYVGYRTGTFGESFVAYQRYAHGQLWTWPFETLILTPFRLPIPVWKTVYNWLTAAMVLAGLTLTVRECRSTGWRASENPGLWAAVWLWGTSVYVFALSPGWAFDEFHRYVLTALPPNVYFLRHMLPSGPRGRIAAVAVGGTALAMAAWRLSVEAATLIRLAAGAGG